ncbi:MAG: hypothetical protein JXA23_00050 [Bacteroidales bacterium]|nr:hypothetical protein [Bacteroidales bacterium]
MESAFDDPVGSQKSFVAEMVLELIIDGYHLFSFDAVIGFGNTVFYVTKATVKRAGALLS